MSVARFFALVIPGFPKRAIRNPSQIPWKEDPGRLRHLRAASYIWKPFGTLLFLSFNRSMVVWFYFTFSREATPLFQSGCLLLICLRTFINERVQQGHTPFLIRFSKRSLDLESISFAS